MNIIEYKPSKYNFYFYDEYKNLFLYNFIRGTKSLFVVKDNELKQSLPSVIDKSAYKNNADILVGSEILNELYKNGFLIPKEENELLKLQGLYMDTVLSSRLELTIMPTEECNFRCPYCYEDHKKGAMSLDVQKGLLKFIQKNLNKYTSLHISWFGGEPLETPEIIENISREVIKICRNKNKPYSSSITTNGYYLTQNIFEKLCDLKILSYQVTLDGLEEHHNKQRYLKDGSGSHEVIVNNLLSLSYDKRIYPSIMIRTNFSKDMIENLEKLVDYYGEKFSSNKMFNFLFRQVGNYGGETVKILKDKLLEDDCLSQVYEQVYKSNYNFNFAAQLQMLGPSRMMCYANKKNKYVIGSDGQIYKCTCDFKNSLIGNLSNNGDLLIDEYKNIQWYAHSFDLLNKHCTDCVQSPSCLSGSCPRKNLTGGFSCNNAYSDRLMQWIIKCANKFEPIKELKI